MNSDCYFKDMVRNIKNILDFFRKLFIIDVRLYCKVGKLGILYSGEIIGII